MTAPKPEQQPVFVLRLTPEKTCPDPARALRRALKVLLRRFGLRCVAAEEVRAP
jgi:hypothetical protein